jgi:uncharacterized spore protein YtfJ
MMDTSSNTEELIRQITNIPDELSARSCFGTPVEKNGHTVIPVSRVSFGYGLGFGRGAGSDGHGSMDGDGGGGEGEGGGGGGGGGATPVAVIDITDGGVAIEPITDSTRIATSSFIMAGWALFWITWTVRTIARERSKTRRLEIEKGLGG